MNEGDRQIAEALKLAQGKIQQFMQQRKLGVKAAAKVLKVARSSLRRILAAETLPALETLKKLQAQISFAESEIQQLEIAYSRRATLSRSKGRVTRTSRQPNTTLPDVKPLGELEALRARVERLEQWLLPSNDTGSTRLRDDNTSFEALLNSEGMEHYTVGDLPQVLTAANFRPLSARAWTSEQRQQCSAYIAWLVDVLRKYLNIVAQLEPEDFRRELLQVLHPRLNQLWRSFKIATSVNPPQCVELMQLEDSIVARTSSNTKERAI